MKLDGEKLLAKLRYIEAGINDEIKSEKDKGALIAWYIPINSARFSSTYQLRAPLSFSLLISSLIPASIYLNLASSFSPSNFISLLLCVLF